MAKVLYYETMAVQWITNGIIEFFNRIGYHVYYDTVQEINEKVVPLDRIYGASKDFSTLVFAIQFKAPYQKGRSLGWKLDNTQQNLLKETPFREFIWYGLPYFVDVSYFHNALNLTHFLDPITTCKSASWILWDNYALYSYPGQGGCEKLASFFESTPCGDVIIPDEFQKRLNRRGKRDWSIIIPYDSWGTLYYKLLKGMVGFSISSEKDYEKVLSILRGKDSDYQGNICEDGIILSIDTIKRVIGVTSVISKHRHEEEENSNISPYDWEE